MADPVDALIAAIAIRQQINVTRAQLLSLGLDRNAITYRLRVGRLYLAFAGVYSVGRPLLTPLERAAAAVLACGDGAVLSHIAALALWGFIRDWPERLHVTTSANRRPAGITVHRSTTLTRRDKRRHHGIPVTSPARSLLDAAPHLPPQKLRRAVNDALHSPFLNRSHLAEVCLRYPRHPGVKFLAEFVDTADGPTRSTWEDTFVPFCERFGLPRPLINTKVLGYEADAYFEAERLIVELDSWEFHRDRAAFERDRNRDADMLTAQIATVRITWTRISHTPVAEANRLEKILARRRATGYIRNTP
jgi:hypothetical protein